MRPGGNGIIQTVPAMQATRGQGSLIKFKTINSNKIAQNIYETKIMQIAKKKLDSADI